MNSAGIAFVCVSVLALLALPRRWAMLPLLANILWMTAGQVVVIGPANFTILRIVIAVGFLRVLLRGERMAGGMGAVDKLVLAWGALLMAFSPLHAAGTTVFHAGIVWNELGAYFLFRRLIADRDDVLLSLRLLIAMMLPVAAFLLLEKSGGGNAFAVFGGVNPGALMRDGMLRAGGPFAHPILAGTAGAVCLAAGIAAHGRSRMWGLLGVAAGAATVYSSASSGPLLMVGFVVIGLLCWRVRWQMSSVRLLIAAALLSLALVMKAPIWFLMARVDLTGGSEGWFRAQLIQSALEHLPEWWLIGTDATRHWMATGIAANAHHTDITNHFLSMGIRGGLALLILFVCVIAVSFRNAGRAFRAESAGLDPHPFLPWTLGALMFGFMMNFFAITLFDQTVLLFWLTVAALAALANRPLNSGVPAASPAARPLSPYLARPPTDDLAAPRQP